MPSWFRFAWLLNFRGRNGSSEKHDSPKKTGSPRGRRSRRSAASQGGRCAPAAESLESRELLAGDMVLDWNDHALDAIRGDRTAPPRASRALAIVHAAVFDAVNAVLRTHQPYAVDALAIPGTSVEAAAAAAAHRALTALFPGQAAALDAHLAASLAAIPDGPAENLGVNLGRQVADQLLALRATDGHDAVAPYTAAPAPGVWRPTPPGFAAALLPQWGSVTPWTMTSTSQFNPAGPPALASGEYAAAFQEVLALGSATSATRTADQTAIAKFWANGPGTSTPPGHVNEMAQAVALAEGNSLAENARLFALLNLALADAAIMAWNTKYVDNHWRPVTAIHEADADGNPATAADPNWMPLLNTPPFPGYVSGHASFSGAGEAVLREFFGRDNVAFVLASEDPAVADRAFTSFSHAAEEAAVSRLYGGIHFAYDNDDGLAAGRALGARVANRFLQAQARPFTAAVVDGVLVVQGSNDADRLTLRQVGRNVVLAGAGRVQTFALAGLTRVAVELRGGDDTLRVDGRFRLDVHAWGGDGHDVLAGGDGHDQLFGGEGRDQLFGGDGHDILVGGAGDDWLHGGRGHDALFDTQGRNTLIGGHGNDNYNGKRRGPLAWR